MPLSENIAWSCLTAASGLPQARGGIAEKEQEGDDADIKGSKSPLSVDRSRWKEGDGLQPVMLE